MSTNKNHAPQESGSMIHIIEISALVREDKYQIRDRLDHLAVGRYFNSYRNGVQLPPVQVAQVGNRALILVDGYHRVLALEQLGRFTVEAVIIPTEERKARWLAAQANLTHGVPLKNKERRAAFRAYIRAGEHKDGKGGYKSYRTIAGELGFLSLGGVYKRMGKDFPSVARKMKGEVPLKGKGDPDRHHIDPQQELAAIAWGHLTDARAALEGFTDPTERGEFIFKLEGMLQELRAGKFQPFVSDF